MSEEKGLRSKIKGAWYKAGAAFTVAGGSAAATAATPGAAYAASPVVPQQARSFITGACDALFMVAIVVGVGFIAFGIWKIGMGLRDVGQSPNSSDGFGQIGGGVLVCLAGGLFKSIPSIMGI